MMVGEQANDYRWSTTMSNSSATDSSAWSRYEDKVFERALVAFPEEMADRWEKIAERIPGKSAGEVRAHYEALVQDVIEIDSGRVELPSYPDESESALVWEAAESSQISLFLIGLQTFGKGDWRSISRNVVVTRTPTQVASHAQKFFLRQNSIKKDRKRSSIHDITTTADTQPIPPPSHFPNQGGSIGYQNFNYSM
ncbi:hypothetical protein C3L33_02671, partial [Rhododendron williamsianum]